MLASGVQQVKGQNKDSAFETVISICIDKTVLIARTKVLTLTFLKYRAAICQSNKAVILYSLKSKLCLHGKTSISL